MEVIRNALFTVAEEMKVILQQSAYSSNRAGKYRGGLGLAGLPLLRSFIYLLSII
jgi:N-methylhydantoinase B/oxoprolinase/acetone carboxylase alpha subunit